MLHPIPAIHDHCQQSRLLAVCCCNGIAPADTHTPTPPLTSRLSAPFAFGFRFVRAGGKCLFSVTRSTSTRFWVRCSSASGAARTHRSVAQAHLVVRFVFKEPEASSRLTCDENRSHSFWARCDLEPDVEMIQSGEVAHLFWLGRLNVPQAIATRKVTRADRCQGAGAVARYQAGLCALSASTARNR
jgi:hypothetical protein